MNKLHRKRTGLAALALCLTALTAAGLLAGAADASGRGALDTPPAALGAAALVTNHERSPSRALLASASRSSASPVPPPTPALGEAFRRGIALDAALKALQSEEDRAEQSRLEALISACRSYAAAEQDWADHAERVRSIALLLFDTVFDKDLGMRERALLECAALLHDLGVKDGLKAHHKASMKRIMASDLPFADGERRMVAVVARYHRRKLPRGGHEHYTEMTGSEKGIARKLAALLRAADGLDRTGGSDWRAEDTLKEVILRPRARPSASLDPDKTSLFKMEFSKELRIA